MSEPCGVPSGSRKVSRMVGAGGLEPLTSSVSGRRSNQLSYAPIAGEIRPKTNVQYNRRSKGKGQRGKGEVSRWRFRGKGQRSKRKGPGKSTTSPLTFA